MATTETNLPSASPTIPQPPTGGALPPREGQVVGRAQAQQYANMLVYGAPGVGKTFLGATGPGPILYLDADDGLMTIERLRPTDPLVQQYGIDLGDIYSWPVKNMSDLANHILRLRREFQVEPRRYGTIVLDNLTELQRILMSDRTSDERGNQTRMPELRDWGVILTQMQMIVRQLKRLPCHIIFTAHEQHKGDMIGPALSGKIYDELPGYMDIVVRYLMAQRTVQDQQTGEVRTVDTRALRCVPMIGVMAKDRSGRLSEWERPNLKDLIAKIFNT